MKSLNRAITMFWVLLLTALVSWIVWMGCLRWDPDEYQEPERWTYEKGRPAGVGLYPNEK